MMNKRRNKPVRLNNLVKQHTIAQFELGGVQDLFGVEIELEGQNVISNSLDISHYWAQHKDGSLRIKDPEKDQAIEYVSRRPHDYKHTIKALELLIGYLKKDKVVVYDSYRTSIHVHVNFMDDTIRTVCNFITLAVIFDELFVSQNGQTRIGNNFCLRTRDAEGQLTELIHSINNYGNPFNLSGHNRYSSFNISSLNKFGTIEFRSLECTTDLPRIVHWIDTLQALKVAARKYDNPRQIIAEFSKKGLVSFITQTLGDQALKYLAVPDFQEMVHTGMRLAQDLAYCSEWVLDDTVQVKVPIPKMKKYAGLDLGQVIPAGLGNFNPPPDYWNQAAQAGVLVQQPAYMIDPEPIGFDEDDL